MINHNHLVALLPQYCPKQDMINDKYEMIKNMQQMNSSKYELTID